MFHRFGWLIRDDDMRGRGVVYIVILKILGKEPTWET
jgi:hypothetical protein